MIDFAEFKKFFLFNLIGALIISALIAVITVLVGEFNEVSARVLFTLLMVVIHSLVSLAFIWDNERRHTFDRLSFFINVIFILVVLSFLTSIFGIWEILPSEFVTNIYQTYFVIAFASLHGNILAKALNKETYIDVVVYLNYLFMAFVVLMLLPIIYIQNTSSLGEFYFRLLAAVGIIDGTLSILTIIFYKLYMHKHPREESPLENLAVRVPGQPIQQQKRGLSIWVWILIIYLIAQVIFPFFFGGLFRLF